MNWKLAMNFLKTSQTKILFNCFLMHPSIFWIPRRQKVWSLKRHRTDLTYDSFRWRSSGDAEIRERQSRAPEYRLVSAGHGRRRDSRWAPAVPRLLPFTPKYLYSRSNLAWKSTYNPVILVRTEFFRMQENIESYKTSPGLFNRMPSSTWGSDSSFLLNRLHEFISSSSKSNVLKT